MSMEVEGDDGSKLVLRKGAESLLGRGLGFYSSDRTVSRHHVSLKLKNSVERSDSVTVPRVSFEVIGRNPIWVWSKRDGEIRVYRKFQKGELQLGDRFCLSGKAPIWFNLKESRVLEVQKRLFGNENEVADRSKDGLDSEEIDISGIDPVKEFGFVVIGHEFDNYPRGMIRNVKDWEWLLDEPRKDSENAEDFEEKESMGMRRKRKKDNRKEDDEWTVESEEDKDIVSKNRKVRRSEYSTRSKGKTRPTKDTKGSKTFGWKKATLVDETLEEDDDETLGGFIVDDDEEDQEDENSEEEEEFEVDDDEVDD